MKLSNLLSNGERPRSWGGAVSRKRLEYIEESRVARLDPDSDRYRALPRKTRTLMRRDKERFKRGLLENAKGCFHSNGEAWNGKGEYMKGCSAGPSVALMASE